MVLMVHVGYILEWPAKYTWTGYYGVILFFVLSGYLSMVSMENSASAWEFYKKRLIRIVPLYWVLLTIALFFNDGIRSIKYLRYYTFLNMFIPSDDFGRWNNMNGFWTIPAFIFFYLTVPLIFKFVRRYYVSLIILTVILFCRDPFVARLEGILNESGQIVSGIHEFAEWMPLSVFYCFFLGVTVFYACKERQQFSFALLCIISLIYNEFKWFGWDIAMALLVLGAAVLPPVIVREGMITRIIKTASAFSFAQYLTHIMVLGYVVKLKDFMVPIIRNKGFMIFVSAFCMVIGYLTWRFIEKPLSDRFFGLKKEAL